MQKVWTSAMAKNQGYHKSCLVCSKATSVVMPKDPKYANTNMECILLESTGLAMAKKVWYDGIMCLHDWLLFYLHTHVVINKCIITGRRKNQPRNLPSLDELYDERETRAQERRYFWCDRLFHWNLHVNIILGVTRNCSTNAVRMQYLHR